MGTPPQMITLCFRIHLFQCTVPSFHILIRCWCSAEVCRASSLSQGPCRKHLKKKLQSSEIQMIKKIQDDQVSQCIVFWTWVHFLLNSERIKWWGKWKSTAAFCDLPHFAGQYLTLACKDRGDPLWYQPSSEWAAPVAGTGRCCITWRL